MAQQALTTTVVGSYPQPDWLVDRTLLSKGVPRVRLRSIWRVAEEILEQAQDDATVVAIRDMERASIDMISDGEIRRESYSNRFATALEGVDVDQPAVITDRYGNQTQVPRVVGPIRRTRPVELRDMQFLRRNTDRPAKITLPGPFTMAQQARNETTATSRSWRWLTRKRSTPRSAICRPRAPMRNDPEAAKRYAVPAINRALAGLTVPTAVHLCFGYAAVVKQQKPTGYSFLPQLADTVARQISIEAAQPRLDLGVLDDLAGKTIILGVIDLADRTVETIEQVTARIRAGLARVPAERLILAPDCGMKYLPRETAFGKLCALSAGARAVRDRLAQEGAP